ncbi:MAG: type I-C CRISPR-associated protein Cas8c/Csd1, partial [Firmicutes bacterium]|nr:type I-C CRISPR-associated protein Cas8c/Csd1 [Bacillota bacterium]
TALLARIRAEQEVSPVQAAMIKACLARSARISGAKEKEGNYTVSLNEEWTDTAYLLGRLFATLEKVQQDAASGAKLNATIRDRYFGAASATPRSVFPVLLRLAQHHIAKAEYGGIADRQIEAIVGKLDSFPAHLNLEEQGNFVLGYYHQRQDFYRKRSAETQETPEEGQ